MIQEASSRAVRANRKRRAAAAKHARGLRTTKTIPRHQNENLPIIFLQTGEPLKQFSPQIGQLLPVNAAGLVTGEVVLHAHPKSGPSAFRPALVGKNLSRHAEQPRQGVDGNDVESAPADKEHLGHNILRLSDRGPTVEGVVENEA